MTSFIVLNISHLTIRVINITHLISCVTPQAIYPVFTKSLDDLFH